MMNKLKVSIAQVASLTLLLLTISVAIVGQDEPLKIHYHLAMPHPSSHLFEVSIDVDIPAAARIESLDFQMPKWSPGRYAVFDFAKNVQEVHAEVGCLTQYDERGIALPKSCPSGASPVWRVDDQTWRPDLHGNRGVTLTLNYKVFANDLY
jgi:predicted metalloprotease with PDZ domain